MFTTLNQAFKNTRRGTFSRGTVVCPKCTTAIHLHKVDAVGDEFSARCAKCGHRGFYDKHAMMIEQFIERRMKPRAA